MHTIPGVDDDAMFRMIMKTHLESLGFPVIDADDGKGVVSRVQRDRPAVSSNLSFPVKPTVEISVEFSDKKA